MLIAIVGLSVIGGLILLEGLAFLIYAKKAPVGRKRTLEFLLFGRNLPYTAAGQVGSQAAAPRYAEHPFTGWTLNSDFPNVHGEKIHNRQGFRCAADLESLDRNAFRVYCAGGSSTYCTNIERNDDTWPSLLGSYLAQITGRDVEVINGGVGGFNTFQSFIRLSAYIDHLQPNMVIVYQAKNDLNPFYNGDPNSGKSLPDYSNLMRSLSFRGMAENITPLAKWSFLAKLWAIYKISGTNMSLGYVYNNHTNESDIPNLLAKRTDLSIIQTMQRNMVDLCRGRQVPLLYMTQRVEDPLFAPYVQAINDQIRALEDPEKGCSVFDLDQILPHDDELLVDKMHFSHKGCHQVAQLIARFAVDSGRVTKLEESRRH